MEQSMPSISALVALMKRERLRLRAEPRHHRRPPPAPAGRGARGRPPYAASRRRAAAAQNQSSSISLRPALKTRPIAPSSFSEFEPRDHEVVDDAAAVVQEQRVAHAPEAERLRSRRASAARAPRRSSRGPARSESAGPYARRRRARRARASSGARRGCPRIAPASRSPRTAPCARRARRAARRARCGEASSVSSAIWSRAKSVARRRALRARPCPLCHENLRDSRPLRCRRRLLLRWAAGQIPGSRFPERRSPLRGPVA